jgi:hypothetical protein
MKTKRHPLRLGAPGTPVAFTLADPAVARLPCGFGSARRLEPGSDPLSGRRQAQAAPGRARSRALTPTPAGGGHAVAGGAGSAVCDVGGWKRLNRQAAWNTVQTKALRPVMARRRSGVHLAGTPHRSRSPRRRPRSGRRGARAGCRCRPAAPGPSRSTRACGRCRTPWPARRARRGPGRRLQLSGMRSVGWAHRAAARR